MTDIPLLDVSFGDYFIGSSSEKLKMKIIACFSARLAVITRSFLKTMGVIQYGSEVHPIKVVAARSDMKSSAF